jgi:hypothetical protein
MTVAESTDASCSDGTVMSNSRIRLQSTVFCDEAEITV